MVRKLVFAALAGYCLPAAASAQQIVLTANDVVGASSVYFVGAGNQGSPFVRNGSRVTDTYGAGNIFNSQLTDPVPEVFSSGQYFITGDGQSQPTVANPYVTVDLGAIYSLSSFTLFNTSNGFVNDRGTAGFTILGANALAVDGNNGSTLAGTTVVLANSTLNQQTSATAPAAQPFASQSSDGVRYIQFIPTSATASSLYNSQSYGLNELKVYGTLAAVTGVPEPGTWLVMTLGVAATGMVLRRRRETITAAAR